MPRLLTRRRSRRQHNTLLEAFEPRVLFTALITPADDGPELPAIFDLPVSSSAVSGADTGSAYIPAGPLPISALQKYHSRASATAKLYLNFVGAPAQRWGMYNAPAETPFSTDGDTTTFSDAEQATIYEVWARVSEKYSPFDLDVTTEDPGNRTAYQTVNVIFASENGQSWLGGTYGGLAFVNSFSTGYGSSSAYVFPANLGPNVPRYMAEAAAHESGHTFGLQHQSSFSGTTKVAEYNGGNAETAPVMGNSYSAARGLWWSGTNTYNTQQDDLSVIAGNNHFTYRADDHSDSILNGDALTMSGASASAAGVIEKTSDVDVFNFTTAAGNIQFTANSAAYGAMLDLRLDLYDSAGTLVASANNAAFSESLNLTVAAGTYHLAVRSNGAYGDVGQYTVTGTVVSASAPAAPGSLFVAATWNGSAMLTWNASAGGLLGYTLEISTDGSTFSQLATVSADSTSFQTTSLIPLRTYWFRVSAFTATANSPFSEIAQLTIQNGFLTIAGFGTDDIATTTISAPLPPAPPVQPLVPPTPGDLTLQHQHKIPVRHILRHHR